MTKRNISRILITFILTAAMTVGIFPGAAFAADEAKKPIPVTGITLDKESVSLNAGDSMKLKVTIVPEDAANRSVSWKSSDRDIVSVSGKGEITANKVGTATVTAVSKDGGFEASCEVRVLFSDLGDASDEFYAPVYWALENGIAQGASDTSFEPEEKCSREEAVMYVYNLMEKPEYSKGTTFTDVKKTDPCYDAVSWAEETGLLKDITEGDAFDGRKLFTKEQFVTLLYRVKEEPYVGYDGRFVDNEDGSYYKDAVNWSVENNIADGYRNSDGSSRFVFGTGDVLTREDSVVLLYNYAHAQNQPVMIGLPDSYAFPVLRSGDVVTDEIYSKYTNPEYCAEVFAYYALAEGWQYEAVVGALAFMWAEGLSANGTFTYEGCWTVTGPSGSAYDRLLDNEAWHQWVHSADCREQMIALTSYYNDSHYATGLGYCGESNAWNRSGGAWVQTLNRCDIYLAAADMAGVAWQDINFQTQRALDTIRSCTYDPDFRDPATYTGDAKEYCARVFSTVGYTAFPVWYDNGQLQAHLNQVETVRPFVDAVLNHTSLIEEDLKS